MAHDPTDIAGYLDGAKFPATGGELAGVAAGNGAPEDVLTRLHSFEGRHFEVPTPSPRRPPRAATDVDRRGRPPEIAEGRQS